MKIMTLLPPRVVRVQNKSPAPIQITADQILREAREHGDCVLIKTPKQNINDSTELSDYRLRKRKGFEDLIRRQKNNVVAFIKYANWEASQNDFTRARSVWERALEVDYKNHTLWLKYANFEMENKFIDSARSVWDRATLLLPRVDQLWFKYVHMEEMLGNVGFARGVFESWEPEENAWLSYVKFELRYNEIERARVVFERFVNCRPTVGSWIRFAKFEMKNGEICRARNCYERAVDNLADEDDQDVESLFVAFAEFEDKYCKEIERARVIYQHALHQIPKGRADNLYKKFVAFENQYGDREGIEDAIVGMRRFEYEDQVRKNPLSYYSWFDYIRLEETVGTKERIREIYERAIANIPPAQEKRHWQIYVYIWINYALYEELVAEDIEQTRNVYKECLKLIPHKEFSFAKIWLMAAQFEIRQLSLAGARRILGQAIVKSPKDKIFKKYIEIELQLGSIDRCRKLYEKYVTWSPESCYAWSMYAELERSLGENDRVRSIFELAVAQPALDMPELLWKAYIDFEISEGEFLNTRRLYERLLERTKHVKVWISLANFEASAMLEDQESVRIQCLKNARRVFENTINYISEYNPDHKEERAMLLKEWLNLETSFGKLGDENLVLVKMPKKLKRRRLVDTDDGHGYEEYIDYTFPEETQAPNMKILEAAYRWKKQNTGSHVY